MTRPVQVEREASMIEDLPNALTTRARRWLTSKLREVERAITRGATAPDTLIVPMLDVVDDAGGTHIMLLHDLPAEASARGERVGLAVAAVGGVGFVWYYDARIRHQRGGPVVSEALVAIVQTRDGFRAGLAGRYTRGRTWTFERVGALVEPTTVIQVPTWPAPTRH